MSIQEMRALSIPVDGEKKVVLPNEWAALNVKLKEDKIIKKPEGGKIMKKPEGKTTGKKKKKTGNDEGEAAMTTAVKLWFKREHWKAWKDERLYCQQKLSLSTAEIAKRASRAGCDRTAALRAALERGETPEGYPE